MEFWHAGCTQLPSLFPSAARADCLLFDNCWDRLSRCTSALLEELVTYMFASCSASVHYGITRKGWPPTCLQAAGLQFTTASCERAENVGDLHVCKLQCFSSLRHHAKGWRPTCLQAAVLQFTTASRERVGDLHVCKLQG